MINQAYIQTALDELIPLLGIKAHVDGDRLISLLDSKDLKGCFLKIAEQLCLPISINISFVSKNSTKDGNSRFQSTSLVETDGQGRGRGGIIAQVRIPPDLPLFGSPRLAGFPITVAIGEDCFDISFSLITVMAHELSHVLLHSLKHRERENEIYTDLTPLILGFTEIVRTGRKGITRSHSEYDRSTRTETTHTETTTFGYLSDENFRFAYDRINVELRKREAPKQDLRTRLMVIKSRLNKGEQLCVVLSEYIRRLDQARKKSIPMDDAIKICSFHNAGYIEDYRTCLRSHTADVELIVSQLQRITHYTEASIGAIGKMEMPVAAEELAVLPLVDRIREDVNVAKKYVGLFSRFRIAKSLKSRQLRQQNMNGAAGKG